jgi:outer membrane PBP1 activator LpoA protein
MPKASLGSTTVAAFVAMGLCLSGCTTGTPSASRPETQQSVSPQVKEHQRKQRLRAAQGNYKRLYRPKGCRLTPGNCDGLPRLSPS